VFQRVRDAGPHPVIGVEPVATARPPAIARVPWEGIELIALDWGGTGPPLVLLHPNGFCGGLYEPLALRLAGSRARPIAVDLPGHGQSGVPRTREGFAFRRMAEGVLAVLDALGIAHAAAVGGSLGGGVAVLADDLRPGVWDRVLLAEPVAFPAPTTPPGTPNPMAEGARRRRRRFPDRASMVARYGSRTPLSELAPEALDAYVRWGTRGTPDGVELRCDPAVEATIFELSAAPDGAQAAWAHLDRLSCPATVVAGRASFLPDVFTAQAERCGGELVIVDGGHFVLHESTDRGAELIGRYALAQ
jgi:pimeloyl-ACP methyl ester carboxylesterase